ncbi:MAG: RpiB/LacA/LacB family sugar-phosphate isomerase [Solirubrobacterales bacterium]|nr:RpiB/LacA/LacB family sugar-phosphate isomerase [Solirubrobacterales bacterium]MCB8970556.1 RpiB/LacA/LacB family sugar-phosphate isomerase [Thermoleophilales bacterium]MCO5325717.1 RpiB/LacA/LacB family sugar-phosphate isomerase [Solirubrobacterales bacterium]
MRVACAFDHAGVPLRETVLKAVHEAGHEPLDLGTNDPAGGDDYPDHALAVARAVIEGEAERGILVCGSGAGVAVAACKVPGIRCAMAHDTYTAHQCVEHDDVNVLALGARVIGEAIAADLVVAFCGAEFVGGEVGQERHARRLGKVAKIEAEGLEAEL